MSQLNKSIDGRQCCILVRLARFLMLGLFVFAACTIPSFATPQPSSEAIYTSVAQTLIAQLTLSAPPPTETFTPPVPPESPAPTATEMATPEVTTAVPLESMTPTATNTATATLIPPTPSVPMITATVNTNCRIGPSKYFDVVGYLLVGAWAEVRGRSADGLWWYIQNPTRPSTNCWVWNQTTVVYGDISKIPVVAAPPSPTLTATSLPQFIAVFDNVHDCGGVPYATFKLTNTGTSTLESMNLTITDLDTGVTLFIVNSDIPFMAAGTECPVGAENFPPASVRYVAGSLGSPPPSGHKARATIKLCTSDDLKGVCLDATVDFTVP